MLVLVNCTFFMNWFMRSVRLSRNGCTWEVGRASIWIEHTYCYANTNVFISVWQQENEAPTPMDTSTPQESLQAPAVTTGKTSNRISALAAQVFGPTDGKKVSVYWSDCFIIKGDYMKAIEFFFFSLNNLKPLTTTPLHPPSDFDEAIQRRKGSAIAVMRYIYIYIYIYIY